MSHPALVQALGWSAGYHPASGHAWTFGQPPGAGAKFRGIGTLPPRHQVLLGPRVSHPAWVRDDINARDMGVWDVLAAQAWDPGSSHRRPLRVLPRLGEFREHGGARSRASPLLFDDLLGKVSSIPPRSPARGSTRVCRLGLSQLQLRRSNRSLWLRLGARAIMRRTFSASSMHLPQRYALPH